MEQKFKFIQPNVLLHAAGNNQDTFIHLLKTFLRIAPNMLGRMQEAFLKKDSVELNCQTHSLRNCISLLGAYEQSEALGVLELRTRKGDLDFDPGAFDSLLGQLQQIIQDVEVCLAHEEK